MAPYPSTARPARGRRGATDPTTPRSSASPSEQLAAIWYFEVRLDQHHRAVSIGHAQGQHFTDEWPDLARRKIHHRTHLPPDQLVRSIVHGELRRGPFRSDLRAEVD